MTVDDFNHKPLHVGDRVVFVINENEGKYFIGSSEKGEMLILGEIHAINEEQAMILTRIVDEKNNCLKAWIVLEWQKIEELVQKNELKVI